MATKVIKTIGTNGDYADWDAFITACPTDLVALNEQWTVVFKNQVHTRTSNFSFSAARTTDANCYFEFTAETGGAWCDASNVRSKAFALDDTFGATLVSSATTPIFNIGVSYTRLRRLQIKGTANSSSAQSIGRIISTALYCDIDQCIFDGYTQNTSVKGILAASGSTNVIRNSLFIQRSTVASAYLASISSGTKAINCTFVSLNVKLNSGIETASTPILKNIGVFNVTAAESSTASTKTNCYTDGTGTGWLLAPYSTATFESITAASPDFRLKTGSALIDAGVADATYATYDATGYPRPAGAGTDVGAWEAVAAADVTPPTLTNPTGSATGVTTSTGSVTTDEGNGTLYCLASTSATVTVAQVKSGLSQAVTSAGPKTFNPTGLAGSTQYYHHYLHRDAAGNDSAVVTSSSFTTQSSGDTVAPVLVSPTGTANGANAATGTVATDEAGGLLYYIATPNSTETAATIRSGPSQPVGATGTQNVALTGLAASTTYRIHYVQVDASGNQSNVVSSAAFTTSAPVAGTLTTPPLKNAMGAVYANITNLTLAVMNSTTLAQVALISGEITDGAGVCVATQAQLVPGTTYVVAFLTSAGLLGIANIQAT